MRKTPLQDKFQPTLPARGATSCSGREARLDLFQPTLPARGATTISLLFCACATISTHTPRTGSDAVRRDVPPPCVAISTHTPRTGSDGGQGCPPGFTRHFNPHSPHGERRDPRAQSFPRKYTFQPTLPARGATVANHVLGQALAISTHTPRTGSDAAAGQHGSAGRYFNPHSPHGERPLDNASQVGNLLFQPTLPARGATRLGSFPSFLMVFQPTLPARGATFVL